jgi:hypothetical protein
MQVAPRGAQLSGRKRAHAHITANSESDLGVTARVAADECAQVAMDELTAAPSRSENESQ